MDRRENALAEGIAKNEDDTIKWTKYREDNKQAEDNLKTFGEKLEVEVMVPIGGKALMPGTLIHTNEVFVSHFRGMFSHCSSFQAQKILKHRIGEADKQLRELKAERDLFENKLNMPRSDGVLANAEEHEIIEKYDEEKEKIWREQHRQRLKEEKLVEKEQRNKENSNKSDADIITMLGELELMEELDNELDQLEVDDDETLRQIIAGEIKLPEKKRIAREKGQSDVIVGNAELKIEKEPPSTIDAISEKYKNINLSDYDLSQDMTNNNRIPNREDFENGHDAESDESDTTSASDIPKEILDMEKEIENFSKDEKIKFYKKQIKHYETKIDSIKIREPSQLEEKMNYIEIRDTLLDYLEILQDLIETEDEIKPLSPKKSRKITFAAEDQIKYIDKNERVTDMFKQVSKTQPKRDIIKLDPMLEPNLKRENYRRLPPSEKDKKKSILDVVEKSMEFQKENLSHEDFNLVDKIINSGDITKTNTLHIKFSHSSKKFELSGRSKEDENVIGSPIDIYKCFMVSNETRTAENFTTLKDADRNLAYEDVRSEFSLPNGGHKFKINKVQSTKENSKKSILKNNGKIIQEDIPQKSDKKNTAKQKKKKVALDDECSGFDLIMGDIIENSLTEPEPLPKEKFIDSLAPKKRISRFKQQRST